jgi:glucose/arabinose dehydrogenase
MPVKLIVLLATAILVLPEGALSAQNQQTPPQAALVATYDARLRAPPDIAVSKFATVDGARGIAVGPDGAIYVSQTQLGQITRIVDANGDGTPEQQTVVLRGLNLPHGMAFHDGWMYVANTNAVVRYRLDRSNVPAGEPQTIATYSWGSGHFTRSIAFGADGALYVSIGSSCNLCEERTPDRASVMRFDPNGGGGRVFSSGLRNAVGIAMNPVTGKIWVSQNERDELRPDHEDLPPEEINILEDGAHYGWPYCYGNRVPNPEYGDPAKCANTRPPALMMQAHSAPLGITFLDRATGIPATYRGDLLVAFHGSWNRAQPTGAKVVRVRIAGGLPVSYEDFVVGWQLANGNRWGRPVDLAVTREGAVLISDDLGGVIWRVAGR